MFGKSDEYCGQVSTFVVLVLKEYLVTGNSDAGVKCLLVLVTLHRENWVKRLRLLIVVNEYNTSGTLLNNDPRVVPSCSRVVYLRSRIVLQLKGRVFALKDRTLVRGRSVVETLYLNHTTIISERET